MVVIVGVGTSSEPIGPSGCANDWNVDEYYVLEALSSLKYTLEDRQTCEN